MSHLKWKRAISKLWPQHTKNRKIILLYHSVGDTPWGLKEQFFLEQMTWLKNHCKIMTLSNLVQAETSDDIQVAITFDDGYLSVYEHAFPILSDKNIPATLYINTGWISEDSTTRKSSQERLGHYPDEYFATRQEIKTLHHAGWTIGSHGVNHLDFSCLTKTEIQQELRNSKTTIEKMLQTTCTHFSYPWGKHSPLVKNVLKSTGYRYAASVHHGHITAKKDLFILPRITISIEQTMNDFIETIYGKWDFLGLFHSLKGL